MELCQILFKSIKGIRTFDFMCVIFFYPLYKVMFTYQYWDVFLMVSFVVRIPCCWEIGRSHDGGTRTSSSSFVFSKRRCSFVLSVEEKQKKLGWSSGHFKKVSFNCIIFFLLLCPLQIRCIQWIFFTYKKWNWDCLSEYKFNQK